MKSREFKIHLFEVGDLKSCLFSWFCCPFALAQSRTYLDGSSCCFNVFCLPVVPYRWMVRSAYNIGESDNYRHDCILPLCCPCCVVNQLYQTTFDYGNPTTDGGQLFNVNEWQSNPNHDRCKVCFKTCICLPCTVAEITSQSVGMPYCMGFWCLGFNVCFLRNMIRYQYRIKSYEGDVTDECLVPSFYMTMLALVSCILPCITCPLYWTACVSLVMQVDSESFILSPHLKSRRYLVGYSPPSKINQQQRYKQTAVTSTGSSHSDSSDSHSKNDSRNRNLSNGGRNRNSVMSTIDNASNTTTSNPVLQAYG